EEIRQRVGGRAQAGVAAGIAWKLPDQEAERTQAGLQATRLASIVEARDDLLDLAKQRSRLDHLRLVLVVEKIGRNDRAERLFGSGPNGLEDVGKLVAEFGLRAGGINGPHR